MDRDYSLSSPSLEGVLTHVSLQYAGISRPVDIMRSFDRPRGPKAKRAHELKALERYFYDLYGVFMKSLSSFVLDPAAKDADSLKLQALLQEMVKVKRLMRQQ